MISPPSRKAAATAIRGNSNSRSKVFIEFFIDAVLLPLLLDEPGQQKMEEAVPGADELT